MMKVVYGLVGIILLAAIAVTLSRGSFVASAQVDLMAVYVNEDLPVGDPESPLWDRATRVGIPMSAQNIALPFNLDPTVDTVNISALHNGSWLAFRLEWTDPTRDLGGKPNDYRDSVALQFPVHGGEPFVCMGILGAEVNILHWRADFQRDIEDGVPSIADIFPRATANIYASANDVVFTTGAAAGNPLSAAVKPSPVEDLIATGFGALESQEHIDVTGWGVWDGDTWSVVIARPLVTGDDQDVQFTPGEPMPVALAVWDGDNGDVNGKKAVSAWVSLEIEAVTAAAPAPGETVTIPSATPQLASTPVAGEVALKNNVLWTVVSIGIVLFLAVSVPATTAIIVRSRSK